jgi:hypothetical protein
VDLEKVKELGGQENIYVLLLFQSSRLLRVDAFVFFVDTFIFFADETGRATEASTGDGMTSPARSMSSSAWAVKGAAGAQPHRRRESHGEQVMAGSLSSSSWANWPLRRSHLQLKSTVEASEIAHHKPQESTVNIGRIRSNEVTNPSTISRRVQWFMGLMIYSDVGCLTAIRTTPCKS